MQRQDFRTAVYRAIAGFEEKATLKSGQTVDRPYRSTLKLRKYTRGTAVSVQDITDTSDTLTVNSSRIIPFYVDDLDALQHNYKVQQDYANDAQILLTNDIDGNVLGEYDNANSSVDDGDIGGTDGNGFTLTTANVNKVFTIAKRKLRKQHVAIANLFGVISPEFEAVLLEYLSGRETALGDSTGMNGHIGKWLGFNLYVSDAVGWSATLQMATNPTADDTVTVNGVAWTFKATPSAAGEVDIGADAAASRVLLVAAINGTGTQDTAATYYEVSDANRDELFNITATDVIANTNITFKALGFGSLTVSETLTAAADVWTPALQVQHNLFGVKGSVEAIVQKAPNVEVKSVPDKLGRNILPWTLFGVKTFVEGKRGLVDVQIRADNF